MNKIVVELHPEDRARLDAIISSLQALAAAPGAPAEAAPAPAADFPVEGAAHLEPPADPEPVPVADPEPAPAAKPVSLAEFQKAITLRCAESAKTKEAVRALVKQYAGSVSDIPEDKRSEVLAKLAEL